ncbi:hypothetical protein [Actinocrispum sp. NPDC049592]|uniref:hypothetical protein n=1 Tax=Actinocrispum sp. NPDC049592 TaxID=3154835 RepID=UPI0034378E6F
MTPNVALPSPSSAVPMSRLAIPVVKLTLISSTTARRSTVDIRAGPPRPGRLVMR